jgi:hypothetical protein
MAHQILKIKLSIYQYDIHHKGSKLINRIPTVHYNFWNDIDVLEDVGISRAQFFYWWFKAFLYPHTIKQLHTKKKPNQL